MMEEEMFFKKPAVFVEIEKGTRLPELTEELRDSLATLQHHPAFEYLLQRMRIQKTAALASLANEGDVDRVKYWQAAIYWLGFLENDIKSLTKKPTPTRNGSLGEAEQFNRIAQDIELIGR